jgi:PAS domain S-box-containing protein
VVVDIKTLMICNLAVAFLFYVAFTLHFLNHKTYPGFKIWTVALLLHALGFVFLSSRGIIPVGLSVLLSNGLLICSLLLRVEALRSFLRLSQLNKKFYALVLFTPLLASYFYFVDNNLVLRTFVLSFIYLSIAVMLLWLFVRHAPSGLKSLYYLGAFFVGVRVLFLMVRAISGFFSTEFTFLIPTHHNMAHFFVAFISEIGLNVVFLMMHLQRGDAELRAVNCELIDSKNRYKSLAEAAFEGVAITENGVIVEVNEHICRMFGYSVKELIGRHAITLIANEDRDLAMYHITSQYDQKYEVCGLRKDQTTFFIEINAKMSTYHGREVRLTAVRDLTEQRKSDQERFERKTLYEFLFEKNASVMLIIDPVKSEIVDANDAACSFYGYTKERLRSMLMTDINVTSKDDLFKEMQQAKAQERRCFHFTHRKADDSLVEVEAFTGPVQFEGQSLLCSIINDITERKAVEAEREKLIEDLQNAAKEISTLRGILPICSHCKNIRNDKGSWDRIELYIQQHSGIELSHGICPDCVTRFYPDLAEEILSK